MSHETHESDGPNNPGRRFYINGVYGGCPSDAGWLALDGAPDPCGWEAADPAIRIYYAPGDTLAVWEQEITAGTIGKGDVFAVFVR